MVEPIYILINECCIVNFSCFKSLPTHAIVISFLIQALLVNAYGWIIVALGSVSLVRHGIGCMFQHLVQTQRVSGTQSLSVELEGFCFPDVLKAQFC